MIFHKTFLVLSVVIGIMLIGGCSSSNTESAANAPGAPAGPQPGAANTGMKDNNSVQR